MRPSISPFYDVYNFINNLPFNSNCRILAAEQIYTFTVFFINIGWYANLQFITHSVRTIGHSFLYYKLYSQIDSAFEQFLSQLVQFYCWQNEQFLYRCIQNIIYLYTINVPDVTRLWVCYTAAVSF